MSAHEIVPLAALSPAARDRAAALLASTFGQRGDERTMVDTWAGDVDGSAPEPRSSPDTICALALRAGPAVVGLAVGKVGPLPPDATYREVVDPEDREAQTWLSPGAAVGRANILVVDPGHRQTGAGRALGSALLDALRAAGADTLVGLSWDNGTTATSRALFERAGFRLAGRSTTYYQAEHARTGQTCPVCTTADPRAPCTCVALLYARPAAAPARGWTVYLLRCADDTLYCGITNDLHARLAAHNTGRGARYTRGRGPVAPVWLTEVPTKRAALQLEAHLKRWPRAKKLALAAGTL